MCNFNVLINTIERVKEFVNMITKLPNEGSLHSEKYTVDAKSIMGIFSINLSNPVEFVYEGSEEDVAEIKKVFGVE